MRSSLIIIFSILLHNLLHAQEIINFEDAMSIALENSPNIRQARLSLERSQELLNAQEAALNSRFSLNIEPFSFSKDRTFNAELSRFNTVERKSAGGTFIIAQPILLTDATLSLSNSFNWFDSRNKFRSVR